MFLVGEVIAKGLAFVNAILGQFATVEVANLPGAPLACTNQFVVYDVTMTECGNAIALQLSGLVEIGLVALGGIFSGLLAI